MTTRGRLALAALVSVALHGLVISREWLPVPQPESATRLLLARLSLPPAIKPAAPKPRVRDPRRAAPTPPIPVLAAASPLALPETRPEVAPAEIVADEPVEPEPPQKIALAVESTAPIAHNLPRRGRITYTLVYGDDRSPVGRVVQSWEAENGVYRITSDAETSGIVELFRPQRLRYLSQGKITREGLRPDSFLMSRTRRGQTEAAQARFDWSASSLDYGLAREPQQAPLPTGTQDLMSLIYQHAVMPPVPGRFRVPVTTGSRFDIYEIEVTPEESIETPIGTLRALPVKQLPKQGMESIQIWLATEFRYLPVLIRHYDREGRFSGEQVVSEIRISEE